MGFAANLALRYLGSKKRDSISVGTAFAILGVALGVAALATVMSVTGGFKEQFQEKVLGVNAHVLVLKYTTNFTEYRVVMDRVRDIPGVVGVAPFSINPMMLTHGDQTATGVLLKGVDPTLSLGVPGEGGATLPAGRVPVLDLPKHIVKGSLEGLRVPGAKPPERKSTPVLVDDDAPGDDAGLRPLTPEYDDAGRNLTILREIERGLEARDGGAALAPEPARDAGAGPGDGADAGAVEARADAAVDAAADAAADAGVDEVPVGVIEPDGGYASVLPDDDVLPPMSDDCDDPAKRAKLPGVVVGVTLAKTLALELGSCVTITSPTIGYSYSGGALRPPVARRFRVIAMFEAGFEQYDSKLVYTDLYEAQHYYDHGDTVTGVEMRIGDVDEATAIARKVDELLGEGIYHTMDWEELNHGLFTALKIQQVGMSAVLALIIVVAAFTVIATLIMVVLDKKKEIAVLKAMGASDHAILRTFLYQGGIIGVTGTALGLGLGFAVCKGLLVYGFPLDPKVYFISSLPVQVRPLEFALTGAIAIAICVLATIFPSLYAAWLRPADGFRDH